MKERLFHLARLLSYPEQLYKEKSLEFINTLTTGSQESEMLDSFHDYVASAELYQIEELFTSTFDMNKTACLELGWHLYGEDYQRGEFLVKMRGALEEYQINESVELPDHISHCLLLLANLDDEEAHIFATEYISKALTFILNGFDKENPYHGLLMCLQSMLQKIYTSSTETINS